ncbi:MAG: DUF2851 family protein [Rikenellaceae bacterium]
MDINQLKQGARSYACAHYLSRCEELYRQQIYTALEHERLTRKYGDIHSLFHGDGMLNWNQTFYLLFMRTLGDKTNQEVFMEVARRVSLSALMRERSSVMRVEAMLIGAAGFVDCYPNRDYIEPLKKESKYMMRKYDIDPLTYAHWDLGRVRPINHPVLRLSQVATLICTHEFIFADMVLCTTRSDIDTLFTSKATRHFVDTHPNLTTDENNEIKIGSQKRNLLGINIAVPMIYAYGYYTHDDGLCAQAQELNESLSAEMNTFIKEWSKRGVYPRTAFESQALIQLTTCYCQRSLCEECPVGCMILKGVIG